MTTFDTIMGRAARALAILALALALVPVSAAAAANFDIDAFDAPVLNADGTPATQAGSHPYETRNRIEITHRTETGQLVPLESARTLRVDLPPGFVGNSNAMPKCTFEQLAEHSTASPNFCRSYTQVGVVGVNYLGNLPEFKRLFNLEPPPGAVAAFGFSFMDVPVVLVAKLRGGSDYGVSVEAFEINQAVPVAISDVRVWGIPADASHDVLRGRCVFEQGGWPTVDPISSCLDGSQEPVAAGVAPKPFLRNPTSCTAAGKGLETKLWAQSWLGSVATASFTAQEGIAGCDQLRFDPTVEVRSTSSQPDSPAGLEVELSIPQDDNLTGLTQADMRLATVSLPEGMTISPSSADGLAACTDAELKLGVDGPAACPDASKIGSVEVETPLLDEKLSGGVYVRSQASSDPASGEMFRIAIEIRNDDRGIAIKLPGQVRLDERTGRVTTTFDDNPQLPFSKLTLKLKGGSRAPLATPQSCGVKTVNATFGSWADRQRDLQDAVAVACPGASGFAPRFQAGALDPTAGAFSPFAVRIDREDRQQYVSGVSIDMPQGVLAKLAGVPLCGSGPAADGDCPAGSRIGTATVGAGPGASPFFLKGDVFLTDGYKGAPYGLAVHVHAKAGPFDLGWVRVRQALYVDPITAAVSVVSDPLPQVVKGVPVRLRSIAVDIDKPKFTINPTSCARKSIDGVLGSVDGATAAPSALFQVGGCASLDLKPELGLSLSGKGQTTDGKHPAITATLVQKPGQSNLKKVRVALPLSLALDVDNANGLCEFADGSKVSPTCPKASIVGSVTATTPILDEPMIGPVYFVKNVRKDPKSGRDIRTLPKLVIPLTGQNGIKLTLTGTSDVEDDRLVTTFDNVPDAPVSSFKLNINGGKGGILAVSGTDICKSTQIAEQQVDGQNGNAADTDVFIQTPSCPTKIISKTITRTTVALKIGGLGAGKVTVTGRGIRKTTKSISKSTVATITAKRTGRAKPGAFKVKFTKAKSKPQAPTA
ncbi:MAG: hypothetical protein ABW167_04940 [Baekduia sp.]